MTEEKNLESEEYATTCVFCGRPVSPKEAVRFEGFISHPGCATSKKENRIKEFDTRLFSVGAIGALIGIVMSIPLFVQIGPETIGSFSFNVYDWYGMAIAYAGIAIGLLVHTAGLVSFNMEFTQREALAAAVVSVVTAAASGIVSIMLWTYGPNPDFHHPDEGFLLIGDIPGFILTHTALGFLFGITSILVGVTIWMLEKELQGVGAPPTLLAFLFIFIGGVLALWSVAPVLYFGLIMFVFATIGMPSYWREESTPVQ